MARYNVEMNDTIGAATSIGSIHCPAAAMRRTRVDFFTMGMEATPADGAYLVEILRMTALGTATAVTPQTLDLADQAAVTLGAENYTVEPTVTAGSQLLAIAQHQRAATLWYAPPGGEIVIPATASAGIVWRTITVNAAAGAITVGAQFAG